MINVYLLLDCMRAEKTPPALALLECALRRVDADKLRRSSNLMLKVILP